MLQLNLFIQGGWHTSKVVGYSNTNIEVIPPVADLEKLEGGF